MRIAVDGIYFGMLPQRSPEDLIALAVEVGADGLNWPFHPDFGEDDPTAMAAAIKAAGLSVISLGLTRQTSAIPGSEADFRAAFAQCAEAAAIHGTGVIDCWPYRPAEVSKADAQAVLASNLDVVVPIAQAAGCVISFEFEPDTTIERYAESLEFIAPWAPSARLTADTYHIIRIGDDLAQAGAALGSSIGVIHFSASHRGEPDLVQADADGGADRCDYSAFLSAALASGYVGDIVLQYAPPADAAASLKRAVALTRDVIAGCGA